jgi:hypothetical protein
LGKESLPRRLQVQILPGSQPQSTIFSCSAARRGLRRAASVLRAPHVTDHAVLRYLERVRGFPVEQLRADIAEAVRRGRMVSFELVDCGAFDAIVSAEAGAVTTVLGKTAPLAASDSQFDQA